MGLWSKNGPKSGQRSRRNTNGDQEPRRPPAQGARRLAQTNAKARYQSILTALAPLEGDQIELSRSTDFHFA
jgi:hypothetical protein